MNDRATLLIVDDDPMVKIACERIFGADYDVLVADNGGDGLAMLAAEPVDVLLLDMRLPDADGLDILVKAADCRPEVPVVIITGYSTVESAVDAIKLGAFDYVPKPFTPEELEAVVAKAVRHGRLLTDYLELRARLDAAGAGELQFVEKSAAMKRVLALIDQVAATDSTVLVSGESGTGKERVARAIAAAGARRDKPFVTIDCGPFAPDVMSSELFGHVKGAFSGASTDRDGLLRAADGGTVLLYEIGNLTLDLQGMLLRTMETSEVRPVGASSSVAVDVRYIAATSHNLAERVAAGRFREDLFYRLNVFPIEVPPLRERRDDIPLLARHFLDGFAERIHKQISGFAPEAMEALVAYDWPGNVRELSNVVERLAILCPGGQIRRALVGAAPLGRGTTVPRTVDELNEAKQRACEEAVAAIEKAFLVGALGRNDHDVARAAAATGMDPAQFQALMSMFSIMKG